MVFKKGESGNPEAQFKKGQSGNPAGYKKGFKNFRTIIKELAEKEICYEGFDGKKINISTSEALVTAMLSKAIYQQDTQAAKLIMDAIDKHPSFEEEGDSIAVISSEPMTDNEWEAKYSS